MKQKFKKRTVFVTLLAILFALCSIMAVAFMLSAMPMTAYAEGESSIDPQASLVHDSTSDHSDLSLNWGKLTTSTSSISLDSENDPAYYYLDEDYKMSAVSGQDHNITIEKGEVYLCLNGYMIIVEGDSNDNTPTGTDMVIKINSGASLYLYDCNSTNKAYAFNKNSVTGVYEYCSSYDKETETCNKSEGATEPHEDHTEITGGVIAGNYTQSFGGGMYVSGGVVEMYGGTIVGNGAAVSGGGVYVDSGTFYMDGGAIEGNTAKSGGGVCAKSGMFEMKDGEISNNTSSSDGGGVYVDSNASFNMRGGEISGNNANSSDGGGVYINAGGKFKMEDGKISGNIGRSGAGVYIHTASDNAVVTSTFEMEDGEISYNTATKQGGGVFVERSAFEMKDGKIINNEALQGDDGGNGGGVFLNGGTFYMDGGEISGNSAFFSGDSLYITGSNGKFNMTSGYFGGEIFISPNSNFGSVSISSGYLNAEAYVAEAYVRDYIAEGSIVLNLLELGLDSYDVNYDSENFPYAVYKQSAMSLYTNVSENITCVTGKEGGYIDINFDNNNSEEVNYHVGYAWEDGDNNIGTGLPADVGEYTVTAYIITITNNTYFADSVEFTITIAHSYTWNFNGNEHWQVCEYSDSTTESEAHNFNNNTCTVCMYVSDTGGTVSDSNIFKLLMVLLMVLIIAELCVIAVSVFKKKSDDKTDEA